MFIFSTSFVMGKINMSRLSKQKVQFAKLVKFRFYDEIFNQKA